MKRQKEEEQKNSLKIAKGKFKMTKPIKIPIYKTVDGKKLLIKDVSIEVGDD